MNIYLIRHGQKTDNHDNSDEIMLSETGFKQAELLGARLSRYNIEKIYSSPMIRTMQTAKEMNKHLNVEIETKDGLHEINMGVCIKGWNGVAEKYPEFVKAFSLHKEDVPYPGGECGRDVWKRVKPVIDEIVSRNHTNVAVVTHGGVIRAIICGILGIGQEKRFFFGSPLENCSVTMIKYSKDKDRFCIHYVNDYSHLEE